MLFPRVRVYAMVPLGFLLTSVALPAWVMLVYWMVLSSLVDSPASDERAAALHSGRTLAALWRAPY